jgi:hypothetical protein
MEHKDLIRTIYLYLFSLVGLVIVVIGSVQLIDIGLKAFVFTRAEEVIIYPQWPAEKVSGGNIETLSPEELATYNQEQKEAQERQTTNNRARTVSNAIALLIVGTPLFLYHWKKVQQTK